MENYQSVTSVGKKCTMDISLEGTLVMNPCSSERISPSQKEPTSSSAKAEARDLVCEAPMASINEFLVEEQKLNNPRRRVSSAFESPNKRPNFRNSVMCVVHNKTADIVCLEDFVFVCSDCALFGCHKGHSVQSLNKTQDKLDAAIEELNSTRDRKRDFENRFVQQEVLGHLNVILAEKAKLVERKIIENFDLLIQKVVQAKEESLQELERSVKSCTQSLATAAYFSTNDIEAQLQWEITAEKVLMNLTSSNSEVALEALLKGNYAECSVKGQQLIENIRNHEGALIKNVERMIQDLSVDIHWSVNEEITKFCNFTKKDIHIIRTCDEMEESRFTDTVISNNDNSFMNLTNSDDFNQIRPPATSTYSGSKWGRSSLMLGSFRRRPLYEIVKQSKQTTEVEQPKRARKLSNGFSASNFLLLNNSTMPNNCVTSRKTIRQTTSIDPLAALKTNDRYSKIAHGIERDLLEIIDLTGAELGDETIVPVLERISKNARVKTLKLLKNKLTDDCITKILPMMTKIQTLNLSHNAFTSAVVGKIVQMREQLPELRSLVLTNTKIMQRKCKAEVDLLRSLGIVVTV